MAARVSEDQWVFEVVQELPAHAVWDDAVLQAEHVQRGDDEGRRGVVEPSVFLAGTGEPGHQDGEAELELRFQVLCL